jgi:hypothetical protein
VYINGSIEVRWANRSGELMNARKGNRASKAVYVLRHFHSRNFKHPLTGWLKCDDEKMIGLFRSRSEAQVVAKALKKLPGFREATDGFRIERHVLDKLAFADGFVTVRPRRLRPY